MQRLLVLCVACFALCLGQELKPGKCVDYTPKVDFEVPPYLGKWLEIARFPTKDEKDQYCNYAEYSDNGDGTVGVHNAGLEADGTYTEIFGYVEPTDVPGSLSLHLDGVPFAGLYDVLETDYKTYTSVYSCISIGNYRVEQAWVLARHILTTEEKDLAFSAFTHWGISVDSFEMTRQANCTGLP